MVDTKYPRVEAWSGIENQRKKKMVVERASVRKKLDLS